MARSRTPSRPPLPRFAVAWFPAFDGIEDVEAFRARHDPMAALIPAHVSLVFPFSTALTQLQIATHVQRVVSRWPPVATTFRRPRLEANEFVFLMAARGAASIKGLHDRLYTRSLAPHLKRDMPYEPHITLARQAEFPRLEAALAEALDFFGGEYSAVMREVELLSVGRAGKIELLQSFSLNTA